MKFKRYLTLAEAARYLSTVCSDEPEVCEADILRLALDGHLKLSVDFVNHVMARQGEVVSYADTEWRLIPDPGGALQKMYKEEYKGVLPKVTAEPAKLRELMEQLDENSRADYVPCMSSLNIDDESYLNLSDEVVRLSDVWDLAMLGAEKLDILHRYQMLTDGPAITLTQLDGPFVKNIEGTVMCQLQERFEKKFIEKSEMLAEERSGQEIQALHLSEDSASLLRTEHSEDRRKMKERRDPANDFYPAPGLPSDCVVVVRTEALLEFVRLMDGGQAKSEKPLQTTERTSLLVVIASLCEQLGFDHNERGLSTKIAKWTEAYGVPVSDDTIRTHLSKINDALESKKR